MSSARSEQRRVLIALLTAIAVAQPLFAQDGTVEGRVWAGARGLRHVIVQVRELGRTGETDGDGRYRFVLPPGTYTLALRLAGFESVVPNVVVMRAATTIVDTPVDWPLFHLETTTVWTPARYPERMAETSAAAVGLLEGDVRAHVTHAQLPRVLAFTPGVEIIQSGLYDFNVNARGFNTALNRHVKTMIDGRDPSVPVLLGYQDWAANLFSLEEIERAEFVRGPGAALYGAGAFNGVLNITTKAPRESPGGYARVTVGQLSTRRFEIRHAGSLAANTWYKVAGGYHRSADFTRARVQSTEYGSAALPLEVIPPPRDDLEVAFGSFRLDRQLGTRTFVAEAGTSLVRGLTTVTGAGRLQSSDTARPWARAVFTTPRITASAFYSGQRADEQMGLSTGTAVYLQAHNAETEVVGHAPLNGGRGRIVAGGSLGWQHVDSRDSAGRQTVFSAPRGLRRFAVFGEVEYQLAERVRAIAAARIDHHALHDPFVSPRVALVIRLTPRQYLRASVSRGFQSPSVTEFFLSTPVAPPVDLSPLERALAPVLGTTPLGLGRIPMIAVGNEALRVERVAGVEAGYTGTVGRGLHVTIDYYRSHLRDFTSNLMPQLGTSLGRVNRAFGPYSPPAGLSDGAAAVVRSALAAALPPELFALLSNAADGSPLFVLLSFANVGAATTQGVEAGIHTQLRPEWRLALSYSFFAHDLRTPADAAFSPNAAPRRWTASISYDNARVAVTAGYRWVDEFQWTAGLFSGPVPSFGVADAQGLYSINDAVAIGVDVANAFDRRHYEMFGGDVLGRRALASIRYGW